MLSPLTCVRQKKQPDGFARSICAPEASPRRTFPALVERFWPVLANEIRQGIVVGEWPFHATDIEQLTQEYQGLLGRR